MLTGNAYFQLTSDTKIVRVLNGMWQVSGAHGTIDPQAALQDMLRYHNLGLRTWDLADHYGIAEDLIGVFRDLMQKRGSADELETVHAFTKWVPRPSPMTRHVVEAAVDISRKRMQMDTLDMLQFHWWDYNDKRYMDAMKHLADLQQSGKIRHLGLTNFDTVHVNKFVEAGIPIVSNQVQYSLIDQRPDVQMVATCQKHNIYLLTYGTLCGGLLTDKYLNTAEPAPHQLDTASLRKYKNMIDIWGGWQLFQQLLTTMRAIADKHQVSIANVAVRYILQKPAVAGVIAGARLGISENRADNLTVFEFALDESDLQSIHAITAQSNDLFKQIGDCGDEYRR